MLAWCRGKTGSGTNSSLQRRSVRLRLRLPALSRSQCVFFVQCCNHSDTCHAIECAIMRRTAMTKSHDYIVKCLQAIFEHDLQSPLDPRLKPHDNVLHVPLVSPGKATNVQRASGDAFTGARPLEKHTIIKSSNAAREAGGCFLALFTARLVAMMTRHMPSSAHWEARCWKRSAASATSHGSSTRERCRSHECAKSLFIRGRRPRTHLEKGHTDSSPLLRPHLIKYMCRAPPACAPLPSCSCLT